MDMTISPAVEDVPGLDGGMIARRGPRAPSSGAAWGDRSLLDDPGTG
jgi:hypothetical protein